MKGVNWSLGKGRWELRLDRDVCALSRQRRHNRSQFFPGTITPELLQGLVLVVTVLPGKRSQDLAFLRCHPVGDMAGCSMGRTGHRQHWSWTRCLRQMSAKDGPGLMPCGPLVLLWLWGSQVLGAMGA